MNSRTSPRRSCEPGPGAGYVISVGDTQGSLGGFVPWRGCAGGVAVRGVGPDRYAGRDARRTPRSLLAYTDRPGRGTPQSQTVPLTPYVAPTWSTRLHHGTDVDRFEGVAGLACDEDELASAYVEIVPMPKPLGAMGMSGMSGPRTLREAMMAIFERFTDRARRVVVLAQEEARMLNHNYIGTEHILLGLIHEGEGVAAKALEALGISLEAVRQQVEEIIGQGQQAPSGHIPFTPRAKKVLELSLREALQLGHNYIGTEHILLGLIREGEGVAAQVLVKLGADLNRVRQQVIQLLSGYQAASNRLAARPRESSPTSSLVLDQFGRNLTQAAREGKLDPVIGREKEIERVMQVLSRRTKNNPVLIGEPGVGKTAVVDGLAQDDRQGRSPRHP